MKSNNVWEKMSDEELQSAREQPDDFTDEGKKNIQKEILRRENLPKSDVTKDNTVEKIKEVDASLASEIQCEMGLGHPLHRVLVEDINMPFGSMVLLMIKWSLASIPAALILSIIVILVVNAVGK